MDQRIEKTYDSLQKSMRSLLGDLPWDQINVSNLCDRAGISRSAFYTHFKNKNDLLDSLLSMFEQVMQSDNNARSIETNGKFKFLPILLNHVSQNRVLFAKNNTTAEGYPVAMRFKNLVTRLVEHELTDTLYTDQLDTTAVKYISGGIYNALVDWSGLPEQSTHLRLLQEIDEINTRILSKVIQ